MHYPIALGFFTSRLYKPFPSRWQMTQTQVMRCSKLERNTVNSFKNKSHDVPPLAVLLVPLPRVNCDLFHIFPRSRCEIRNQVRSIYFRVWIFNSNDCVFLTATISSVFHITIFLLEKKKKTQNLSTLLSTTLTGSCMLAHIHR